MPAGCNIKLTWSLLISRPQVLPWRSVLSGRRIFTFLWNLISPLPLPSCSCNSGRNTFVDETPHTTQALDSEREALLEQLQRMIETPMIVLAFIWLGLFIVEVIWGLNPFLEIAGYVIWGLFLLEYLLGFWLAPRKLPYVGHNWLKGIALVAPALRVFRIFYLLRLARLARVSRAATVARGLRLVRVISSINRGMRALGRTMGRRGFGYVVVLTIIVTLVGAAGMYAFENDGPEGPVFEDYGTAVWWTAMIMTTMGSEGWPRTPEGRVLCVLLALYSFTVFGYVTAVLATFFIGRDAEDDETEVAGAQQLAKLREEIRALREELGRR